jgi:hypothetical protein
VAKVTMTEADHLYPFNVDVKNVLHFIGTAIPLIVLRNNDKITFVPIAKLLHSEEFLKNNRSLIASCK